MVVTHCAAVVGRLIDGGEDVDVAARVRPEVVPLVGAFPPRRQVGAGGMHPVRHLDGGPLDPGVALEVGPDQFAVERPVVLGVGGGVDADEAAAAADVLLEGVLLRRVQDVAGGVEKDDGLILRQLILREGPGVLRRRHGEAVLGAQRLDRRDAVRDGGMAEALRPGEDEHPDVLRRSGAPLQESTAEQRAEREEDRQRTHSVGRVVD